MKRSILGIGLVFAGLLTGCATPTVVETKKTGDAGLSCGQLKAELDEADKYFKAAKKERTVTGTNVAAAVFFLPGLLGTYVNTEEAMTAAREREAVIKKLAEKKKCDLENTEAVSQVQPSAAPVQPPIAPPATTSASNLQPSQATRSDAPFMPMTNAEVQTQLNVLGYPVGAADGNMGKKTIDALKKFQKDNNLTQTGKADSQTVARLRQKS